MNYENSRHAVPSGSKKKKKRRRKRRNRRIWIVFAVIAALIIAAACAGLYAYNEAKDLKKAASGLKSEIKTYAKNVLKDDVDAADASIAEIRGRIDGIEAKLDETLFRVAARVPQIGSEFESVRVLLDAVDDSTGTIMEPLDALLREHPLSDLKGGKIDTAMISAYADFYTGIYPEITALNDRLSGVSLNYTDPDGKVAGYIDLLSDAVELMDGANSSVVAPALDVLQEAEAVLNPEEKLSSTEKLAGYSALAKKAIPLMYQVRDYLNTADLSMLNSVDKLEAGKQILNETADIVERYEGSLINPGLAMLDEYPLSDLTVKTEDGDKGFNVRLIAAYLAFAEEKLPEAAGMLDEVSRIDFSTLGIEKIEKKVGKVLKKANGLIDMYYAYPDLIDLAKIFVCDDADRLYLVAAQNATEIRSLGGFPGNMGLVRVRDGILTIGNFKGVKQVLARYTPAAAHLTDYEQSVFSKSLVYPWDAAYCPDFGRVSEIWALAYEARNGEAIDGVIAVTPVIIQDFLGVFGEVELSDGTVLNGDNATWYLQYQLYQKYLNVPKKERKDGNKTMNTLHSETVKKIMKMATSDLSLSKLQPVIDVFYRNVENRTLLMWFKDADNQNLVRRIGCSGELNSDPQNPVAGVYFGLSSSGKTGWFVDLEAECSDPVRNSDGTLTYAVTVTGTNTMTKKEAKESTDYIRGKNGGELYYQIMVFAPAGGTITNVDHHTGYEMYHSNYKNLEFYFCYPHMHADDSFVLTYNITTAPGVETPLKFWVTPTLTEYRNPPAA